VQTPEQQIKIHAPSHTSQKGSVMPINKQQCRW